jgi:phosphoribosyl-ATP pyrophosphohydrolase/phosphoribosyl-AMP cyclohydrolase
VIDQIDFDKQDGLVPVVVQDYKTNEVLMLAYMNKEALELSLETSYTHFFSRSKNRLWQKGETSGHTQKIVSMMADCDMDTILVKVQQAGVACHTGAYSCFFCDMSNNIKLDNKLVDTTRIYGIVDTLFDTIRDKKSDNPNISYTAKLLQGEQNYMLKKLVEEAGELCFAIKDKNKPAIVYECADLVYHTLVAICSQNISPDMVKQELQKRFATSGIEEKNSRQK